jgi:hypothetical protein
MVEGAVKRGGSDHHHHHHLRSLKKRNVLLREIVDILLPHYSERYCCLVAVRRYDG